LAAEKELMLLKLRAPPGPARSEITQLADIFRASIVDVGEATFTLCVTGDPGKVRERNINLADVFAISNVFSCRVLVVMRGV
jgi:acetolactate synthase small subunit